MTANASESNIIRSTAVENRHTEIQVPHPQQNLHTLLTIRRLNLFISVLNAINKCPCQRARIRSRCQDHGVFGIGAPINKQLSEKLVY